MQHEAAAAGDMGGFVMHGVCGSLHGVAWAVQLHQSDIALFPIAELKHFTTPTITLPLSDLVYYQKLEQRLILQMVKRIGDKKWRLSPVEITDFPSEFPIGKWTQHLDNLINSRNLRKLLFIINPVSGDKKAMQMFAKVVEPMMKAVGIQYDSEVTERIGHATELVQSVDVTKYDGMVALGGDGTVNEIIRGLATFQQHDSTVPRLPTTVGVIPCGTSNNQAYSMHGTDDVETALLHLLLGDRKNIDMLSARNGDGDLVGIAMTLIAYGYISDAIKDSESIKFLPGILPYTISFMKVILKTKKYDVDLKLGTVEEGNTPYEGIECCAFCPECGRSRERGAPEAWVDREERNCFGLQFHNSSGECAMAPRGAVNKGHTGNGCIDLLIIQDPTTFQAFKMLNEVGKKDGNSLQFDYIKALRITSATVTAVGETSCWCLDGEVIHEPTLTINVHHQVVPFFGRGVERVEPAPEPKGGILCGGCGSN